MPYGTIQRTTPRLRIIRGYDLTKDTAFTMAAPVASGTTIVSGQIISLNWNSGTSRYEWVLGGGSSDNIPYIAIDDSADKGVLGAGLLTGLSVLGKYRIQTAFYSSGTYVDGTPLTFDVSGNVGKIVPTTVGGGVPIIGYVSGQHAVLNLSSGAAYGGYPQDSTSASPANVVQWDVSYTPVNPS